MKAIQQHSHILNLTKQASMREAKIQSDEMKLRLDAAKTQQDILLFSIQAMEQKMIMFDEKVVNKMAKSRQQQMRDLKEGLAKKMQELEQRSSRTIFDTAERLLHVDLPRAKKTWKECSETRERLVERHLS